MNRPRSQQSPVHRGKVNHWAARRRDAEMDAKTGGTVVLPPGEFVPGRDFLVRFGKHKGRTIGQVAEGGDRDYVEWIAWKSDRMGTFVRNAAKAYLRHIGRVFCETVDPAPWNSEEQSACVKIK